MNEARYRLGCLSGRIAVILAVPVWMGFLYLLTRLERLDGHLFLPLDAYTMTALIASSLLVLLAGHWRAEAGDGIRDTLLATLGVLPCALIVLLIDPGAAP